MIDVIYEQPPEFQEILLQEHSFDSSIVTEGHYDASFESEVPPVDEAVLSEKAAMAAASAATTTTATSTSASAITNSHLVIISFVV